MNAPNTCFLIKHTYQKLLKRKYGLQCKKEDLRKLYSKTYRFILNCEKVDLDCLQENCELDKVITDE